MLKWLSLIVALAVGVSGVGHAQAQSAAVPKEPSGYSVDAKPPSGLGGLAVGIAGIAGGAFALAIIPVCYASFYPSQGGAACAIGQGVVGALGITAGIIGLSIGLPRRARYKAWRARQQADLHGQLERLSLAAAPGGGLLRYGFSF